MVIGVLECKPVATVSMAAWAEAILHICRVKAIPTSLILISLPRIKIVNQSNQQLSDLLISFMTLILVLTLTLPMY